jgi:myo-inositol-1-phosphate synthase
MGVTVDRGMTHDGLGKYLSQVIEKAPGPTADVVAILKERKVDVMVSYLPVGSEEATKWYAEQALQAGVGFVNAIPVFIGREPYWQRRFAAAGLPVIGDDIKSQVGATISHRVMTRLFMDRGVRLDRTYQLNFGGNTDFMNMLERERLESKKISKTNAVTSMLDYDIAPENIHVGPSDYVPWLKDRKYCYIVMEGTTFGDVPLKAELKLEVWDSPNSAGVIIDAVRCLKIGLDRGLKGTLVAPSSYFMKSPPIQIHDDVARERVEAFIRGDDNETLVGTEESKAHSAAIAKAAGKTKAPTAK